MSNPTVDPHALAAQVAELIGHQSAPPLLDAEQAGRLLNVPASWMLAQARAGRVPHVRLGHYVRFNRDELLAWTGSRSTGRRTRRMEAG
jgi:excisionase family DNA binding protein